MAAAGGTGDRMAQIHVGSSNSSPSWDPLAMP
jgi:hypothetical protein